MAEDNLVDFDRFRNERCDLSGRTDRANNVLT